MIKHDAIAANNKQDMLDALDMLMSEGLKNLSGGSRTIVDQISTRIEHAVTFKRDIKNKSIY